MRRIQKLTFLITTLLITTVVTVFYSWYLFNEPLVYGIDGPYYLLQTKHIIKHGSMYYGDPPLTFYLLAAFAYLLGNPTLALKIFLILIMDISAILLYYNFRCLLNIDNYVSLLSALIFALSPNLVRLAGDFVKNVLGLCILIAFMIYVTKFEKVGSVRNLFALYLVGVAVFLTHILAYGILLVYVAMLLIVYLLKREYPKTAKVLVLLIVLISTSLIAYIVEPFYFSDVQKFVYYMSINISNQRSLRVPVLHPPFAHLHGFLDLTYAFMPIFSLAISVPIVVYELYRKRVNPVLLISFLTLIVLLNPFIEEGVRFRLWLSSIFPVPYILAIAFNRVRPSQHKYGIILGVLILSALMAEAVASSWGPTITFGEYKELLYIRDSIIGNASRIYYIISSGNQRYWIQYIFGIEHVVHKPVVGKPNYLLLTKRLILPLRRPGERVIYDGKYYQVRLIKPPSQ